MLYDPKWEVETKADPLTIPSLIAWLERQPAASTYDYHDCNGECLYGQYAASVGLSWKEAIDDSTDSFRTGVYRHVAAASPRTFGAALRRARKYAASPQ